MRLRLKTWRKLWMTMAACIRSLHFQVYLRHTGGPMRAG